MLRSRQPPSPATLGAQFHGRTRLHLLVITNPAKNSMASHLRSSLFIPSSSVELPAKEEACNTLGFQARRALMGGEVVVFHRICRPQHLASFQSCVGTCHTPESPKKHLKRILVTRNLRAQKWQAFG